MLPICLKAAKVTKSHAWLGGQRERQQVGRVGPSPQGRSCEVREDSADAGFRLEEISNQIVIIYQIRGDQ
jgi:hypothetical protein